MSNQALISKPFGINTEMVESLEDALKIGEIVAKSRMFPEVTDQAKAVVAILAGRELGIPPMASLRGINVIKGKVEVGAGLLAAMIKASGQFDYKVATKADDENTECILLWSEKIGGVWTLIGHSRFTIDDAKRAKLIKPDSNWEKFPRAMLFARALTEGQRKYCPHIAIGAMYAPGEIAESPDYIEVAPEPSPLQVAASMPSEEEIFDAPRPLPDAPLPQAWTADTPAREIADLQIANTIGSELRKIAEEIKAEAPKPPAAPAPAPAAKTAPKDPDPVPALKPTLTPAQQKALDSIVVACREHGKDKAIIWHLVNEYLGRKIKRTAELTDDEASRVFTYMQTLMSQWSSETQADNSVIKYDRKNPAHSPEYAKQLDAIMRKLAILHVDDAHWSGIVQQTAFETTGRTVNNRFELNDVEAVEVIFALNREIELIENSTKTEAHAPESA